VSGVDYDMQRHTLTIAQAIQYFGVSERTIRRWIKKGKVDAKRVGRKYYINVEGEDSLPGNDMDISANDKVMSGNDHDTHLKHLLFGRKHYRDVEGEDLLPGNDMDISANDRSNRIFG